MADEENRSDAETASLVTPESELGDSATGTLEQWAPRPSRPGSEDETVRAVYDAADIPEDEAPPTLASHSEPPAAPAALSAEPAQVPTAATVAIGSGGGHGPGGDHDDHLGHTAPVSLLVGVLVALSLLTILTVAVTSVDLGSQGNFIVAMIIATVKAVLVMGYFMHMFWDARFNVVLFTSSFLFVLLFLAMTLLDRGEYQSDIDRFEVDHPSQMAP